MNNEMTEKDFNEYMDDLTSDNKIDTAFYEVIELLDRHIMGMDINQRTYLTTRLTQVVMAGTLVSLLKDHRYLVNSALERLAEDITDVMGLLFDGIDTANL